MNWVNARQLFSHTLLIGQHGVFMLVKRLKPFYRLFYRLPGSTAEKF